jgi:small basic protein
LFNVVLDTGIIPETWTTGIIIPVYKNKGCPTDPDNFRAITLISCLGKLFTSIVNTRLNLFANEVTLIHENQAGFRKEYSTIDNIFVLHVLIELYFSFGKKLFCTFIDFREALIRSVDLTCGKNFNLVILKESVLK